MSKYYYLVAGLPELTLEDSKLSYTVADFKTELYPALSEDDKKLIDLFYLKFDNANVLKLLKDKMGIHCQRLRRHPSVVRYIPPVPPTNSFRAGRWQCIPILSLYVHFRILQPACRGRFLV